MALVFPQNPTIGQTYQENGSAVTYEWNGSYWEVVKPSQIIAESSSLALYANVALSGSTANSSSFSNEAVLTTLENNIFSEEITITATTAASPTKATNPTIDSISIQDIGHGWCDVNLEYAHTDNAGASNGTGQYIFHLPDGFSFDTSYHPLYTIIRDNLSGTENIHRMIPARSGWLQSNTTYGLLVYVVPYTATTFRISKIYNFVRSGYYSMDRADCTYKVRFQFKRNVNQ